MTTRSSFDVKHFAVGVLWALAALRVVSCCFRGLHDERELRSEASLLLNQVCDIPRAASAGSTLIRCDEAKAVLAQGPLWLVAIERALTYLVVDTLAAARREVCAALQAVGMLGAVTIAAILAVRTVVERWKRRAWEFQESHSTSDMFKIKNSAIVPLRFTEDDE